MNEHLPLQAETEHIKAFMGKAGQAIPDEPVMPPEDVRRLRVKLIIEELIELCDAYGLLLTVVPPSPEGLRMGGDEARHRVYVEQHKEPDASLEGGIKDAYDAVLDLLVVVIGTAIANGTQLPEGWNRVHASNMAKFGEGGHRRADGKWIKPPNWTPPDLVSELKRQAEMAKARAAQRRLI